MTSHLSQSCLYLTVTSCYLMQSVTNMNIFILLDIRILQYVHLYCFVFALTVANILTSEQFIMTRFILRRKNCIIGNCSDFCLVILPWQIWWLCCSGLGLSFLLFIVDFLFYFIVQCFSFKILTSAFLSSHSACTATFRPKTPSECYYCTWQQVLSWL